MAKDCEQIAGRRGKVFYGWWIVAVCILALIFWAGGGYYAFVGVFQSALLADYPEWTRGEVARGATAWWLAMAVANPIVGRLIDAHGVKKMMLISAAATGLLFMLLSLTSTLWHIYVLYAAFSLFGAGLSAVAVGAVISHWFSENRGTAMGVAVTGIGLGGVVMVPLVTLLYSYIGWRETYLVLGGMTWIILIPVVALVAKDSPGELGLQPDGEATDPLSEALATSAAQEWTLSTASRTPAFWLIITALSLSYMGMFGVLTHQVNFATDLKLSLPLAANMLAITAGMGVVGKLSFGYLADRIPVRYAAMLCFLMQAAGVLVLMGTKSMPMFWIYILLFGFSLGGAVAFQPVLVTKFFGVSSVGAILGAVTVGQGLAGAVGPLLAGQIYDVLGSYHWAFVIFVIAYLVAAVAIFLTPRPVKKDG